MKVVVNLLNPFITILLKVLSDRFSLNLIVFFKEK